MTAFLRDLYKREFARVRIDLENIGTLPHLLDGTADMAAYERIIFLLQQVQGAERHERERNKQAVRDAAEPGLANAPWGFSKEANQAYDAASERGRGETGAVHHGLSPSTRK